MWEWSRNILRRPTISRATNRICVIEMILYNTRVLYYRCCLINQAQGHYLHRIMNTVGWLMNNEFQRLWKKRSSISFRHYLCISLEELKKPTFNSVEIFRTWRRIWTWRLSNTKQECQWVGRDVLSSSSCHFLTLLSHDLLNTLLGNTLNLS